MNPFFAICTHAGMVEESNGDFCAPGSTLAAAFARDSRAKLMQLLIDARRECSHTLLQTADGTPVEVWCAADEQRALIVAAANAAGVRTCCEALGESTSADLARMISSATRPSDLSVDLWEELARVNNELANAHRQLARTNAELRWLNEQKNQLLGMAAHDLRNPLAASLGFTTFLLEDASSMDPEHARMVGRIRSNVETMLSIVEDVLDFTAIESGTVRLEPGEIAVEPFLADVAEVCRLLASRKEIDISLVVDPATPSIVADRRKLAQVVSNLITNAIKFSHSGSTVTVAAGSMDEGGAWISVKDRGVGMNEEQMRRLFLPFERVGSRPTAGEKSTGLGLAIVSRIVNAHDGRIAVESEPEKGSTFTIFLPPAPASKGERMPSEPALLPS